MKPLSEFVKDNTEYISESSDFIKSIPPFKKNDEDSIMKAAKVIDDFVLKLDNKVNANKLKRIFKDASRDQLEDYAVIVKDCCIWIDCACAEAEDSIDEDGAEILQQCIEFYPLQQLVAKDISELNRNWKSIKDNKDEEKCIGDVFEYWNDICKVVVGKNWHNTPKKKDKTKFSIGLGKWAKQMAKNIFLEPKMKKLNIITRHMPKK